MLRIVKSFKRYKKALKYIAENISEENRTEIGILAPDMTVEAALLECATSSEIGFFFFDADGNPRAVGGVSDNRCVWFAVTAGLSRREIVPWLKKSRELISTLLRKYRKIWGRWYQKNILPKIWLDWCGFSFAPEDSPANVEINGHKFIYFQKD